MRMLALCLVSLAASAAFGQATAPPPDAPPAVVEQARPSSGDCKYTGSHTAVIRLTVTAAGNPAEESLATSSGDACLDAQAVKNVALYRFRPATRNGQAVATRIHISVNFRKY